MHVPLMGWRMKKSILQTIENIRRKRQMRLDADEEEEQGGQKKGGRKHSGYSTKLPYGIANDLGINTEGLTPREVWDKIDGEGLSHNSIMSAKKENPDKKVDLSKTKTPKSVPDMTADDLPGNLTGSKLFMKEAELFCERVNSAKGRDSVSGRLFRNMKKLHEKCKSSITKATARKHVAKDKAELAVRYSVSSGNVLGMELRVPKITNEETACTAAHEMAHYMDAIASGGQTIKDYMSTMSNTGLTDSISEEKISGKEGIRKETLDMIESTLGRSRKAFSSAVADLNVKLENLNEKVGNDEITYEEYKKEWNKVKKEGLAKANEARWAEDKGTGALMDMYDAMSGGDLHDKEKWYGHGVSYYSKGRNKEVELFANYCELSVFRPDLLKHFEADFPKTAYMLKKHTERLLEIAEG